MRTGKTVSLIILCFCSCFILSTLSRASTYPDLDKKISMDVDGASSRDILMSFEHVLGIPVELGPAIEGPVSLRLGRVSVRTLLNAICESSGCEWAISEDDPPVLVVGALVGSYSDVHQNAPDASKSQSDSMKSLMTMAMTDAPVRVVLGALAKLIRAELEMDPSLADRKITIEIIDVPVEEVLSIICDSIHCDWELVGGPAEAWLKVWPTGE